VLNSGNLEIWNMKILTVTGFKGGVGKSTTAIHLAAFLSRSGKTLLIDGDQNRTSLKWAKRGNLPFQVVSEKESVKFIPSSEFIVIDTPARPASDDLKELATGCNLLILPSAPDVLGLEALLETATALQNANYKALLTIVPPRPSREGELMLEELKAQNIPAFNSVIIRSASFQKAALSGVPVYEIKTALAAMAWACYESFGNEVLEVLGSTV
jgi:chromosome partitioning protein